MTKRQRFPTIQKRILIVIINIFLIGSLSYNVYGIEWNKRIEAEKEALKTRENSFISDIKFNAEPDPNSIENSIHVFGDNGGDIEIKTECEGDVVKVIPLEPYLSGNRYYLFIDDTIQSHCGSGLKQSVIMKFVTI